MDAACILGAERSMGACCGLGSAAAADADIHRG